MQGSEPGRRVSEPVLAEGSIAPPPQEEPAAGLSRQAFLRSAAAAGVVAGGLGAAPRWLTAAARASTAKPRPGLNILFVLVDQMRTPWVYLPSRLQRATMPTISKLAKEGVAFSHFFSSSSMCTPSRTTQATGLYTHQSAIFATSPPTNLNPGFPTFGTMLRQKGYDTYWFGKWHMSQAAGAGVTEGGCEPHPYESYGFTADWPGSGTCPSPNGGPGVGQAMDPVIRQQFVDWLGTRKGSKPWLATVSLVNPHDIAWYPRFTRMIEGEATPPRVFSGLPANFETSAERAAARKPRMQLHGQQIENQIFGVMPPNGKPKELWAKLLNTYLLLQRMVDIQIGLVLDALADSPYADNTAVVFTSDHGEMAGAHGMRGKGFAFYDEAARVPLIVKDPTGTWTKATGVNRSQLVESVDLAALMLTLATGGNDWRGDSTYAQIAGRADIAAILANPDAKGRPYIAYATDEPGTSSKLPTTQQRNPAPNHITAVRTARGKLARYAFWKKGTLELDESKPIQYEAYNYASRPGRLELDNIFDKHGAGADDKALVTQLAGLLDQAMENEIEQPLPPRLQKVQTQAFKNWFSQPPGEFTKHTDN